MSHAFDLHLSSEDPFPALAADVAGRFFEMLGGSALEAAAFGSEVGEAAEALAMGGAPLDLVFRSGADHVEATVQGGKLSRVIRRALPSAR